jgi:signal transduction histidine kinase
VKIGTRLVLALAIPLGALMLLFGYLDQERSRTMLREELIREGRAVARTIQLSVEDYLRDRQMADVIELADHLGSYERILGMRLFDAEGEVVYQSATLAAVPFRQAEALREVLRDRRPVETHRTLGDQPVVSFFIPLSDLAGRSLGAIQVLQLESFIEEEARAARHATIRITALMLLATTAIVLLVTRISVGRPVEALVRGFRELGAGEVPTRLPLDRRDEFGRLAHEFEGMRRLLEASRRSLAQAEEQRRRVETQLRGAERLASLGRMSAGLAHEIGTPLNVIRGRAETLLRRVAADPTAGRNLGIIISQIDRIARIVGDMLDFARARDTRPAPTRVESVAGRVLEFLAPRCRQAAVAVERAFEPGLPAVVADSDQLYQVFLNLATNALDAMPSGGRLRVEVRRAAAPAPGTPGPPRDCVAVAFEDSGTGITAENLERVFDPFFTTKEVGRGTGLGLSVSYGIVREHGGWIDVASEERRGTRMVVYLPVAQAAGPPAAAAGVPA